MGAVAAGTGGVVELVLEDLRAVRELADALPSALGSYRGLACVTCPPLTATYWRPRTGVSGVYAVVIGVLRFARDVILGAIDRNRTGDFGLCHRGSAPRC